MNDPVLDDRARAARVALQATGRWVLAILAALIIFSAFLIAKGAQPLDAYSDMWQTTFGGTSSFAEVLVKWTPILLTALAVAVPGRAGLFNIGGEGQFLLGAIGAAGMALTLDGRLTAAPTLLLMALGAATLGGAWAAITAVLKVATRLSEAISTLLLNYVAVLLLEWLVNGPWKDPASLGFPQGRPVGEAGRFGVFGDTRLHVGVIVAVVVMFAMWVALRSTAWGFHLRVAGGNAEAARRSGLRVGVLIVSAMAAGGALAGLAGMVQVAGVEGRIRPGMAVGVGFIGFLASWMVRHHPLRVAISSLLLAAIAVGGDSLQIDSTLPAASINVLMAFVLLAVLGSGTASGKSSSITSSTVQVAS